MKGLLQLMPLLLKVYNNEYQNNMNCFLAEFLQKNIEKFKELDGGQQLLEYCLKLPVFNELATKKKDFFEKLEEPALLKRYLMIGMSTTTSTVSPLKIVSVEICC